MKKILYIALAIVIFAGCSKEDYNGIIGEWHHSSEETKTDIYVNFAANGTFELYQQITEGAHRLYRGTWKITDEKKGIIGGKYNDGNSWGSEYFIKNMSSDGKSMTLVSTKASGIKYSYFKESIPELVKENCDIIVKSSR